MTRPTSIRRPLLASTATLALLLLHLLVSLIPSADWVLCIEPDLRMTIESSVQGQCTSAPGESPTEPASGSHLLAAAQDHCGTCTDIAFRPPARFTLSPARHLLQPPVTVDLPLPLDPWPNLPEPPAPEPPLSAPTSAIQFRVTVTFLV